MRPSIDRTMIETLIVWEKRSTCPRRAVAAILATDQGQVVAVGYNGVPSGMPHCTDLPCPGATEAHGQTNRCLAIHAEQNALLQAGGRLAQATRMYCSAVPCFSCAKLIVGTNVKRIVYLDEYADVEGRKLLERRMITLTRYRVEGR